MSTDILLAAYQGERYLRPQIDSLLAQTAPDFRILARDDGSTDGTAATLRDYARAHPRIFTLVEDGVGNCGPAGNFAALMRASTSDYVMFCDQDDVWHPAKVQRSLAVLAALEAAHGAETPLLVHGAARVVDAELNPLADDFHTRLRFRSGLKEEVVPTLPWLLVQNAVLGCTAAANRALLSLALPLPQAARMHDHWLALLAAACGRIGFIPEPCMQYRQHAANAIGARKGGVSDLRQTVRRVLHGNFAQAEALRARAGPRLSPENARIIDDFLALQTLPPLPRRLRLLQGGYLRRPWWQNVPVAGFI